MANRWKLIVLLVAAVVVLAAMNLVGRGASTADNFGHAPGSHADSASGESGCCPGH